jgi:hypothetical protein
MNPLFLPALTLCGHGKPLIFTDNYKNSRQSNARLTKPLKRRAPPLPIPLNRDAPFPSIVPGGYEKIHENKNGAPKAPPSH